MTSKPDVEQVITGWRLRDGSVVYLGPERTWVADLVRAARWSPRELDVELQWATHPQTALDVVDAYAFPVDADGPSGRRTREQIRSVGPTVRPDLQRRPT